ncbi:MAG: hypothetical protein ACTSWR_04065 [Candidatus Helarchaeota archaeon]
MSIQYQYDADEVFYGGNPRQKGPGKHIDEDPWTGLREIVPASYFNVIELAIKELQDIIDQSINLQENVDLALKSITASNIYTYNLISRYNSFKIQSNQSHFDQIVYMNFLRVGVKTNFSVYDGISVAEFKVIEDTRNNDKLNAILVSQPYTPGSGEIYGISIENGYDVGFENASPTRLLNTVSIIAPASNDPSYNPHLGTVYRFSLLIPSDIIITHNMNTYPYVQVIDPSGYLINPSLIRHIDPSNVYINIGTSINSTVILIG